MSGAPFGRRRAPVVDRIGIGPYVALCVDDADGPAPAAGQFYMLATTQRWGGGDDERPFLPRAIAPMPAPAHRIGSSLGRGTAEPRPTRTGGGALAFVLHDVGPGTHRLEECRVGEELWLTGPLGRGFRAPDEGRRAVLVAGGIGVPPIAAWHATLAVPATVMLGFRDADHAELGDVLPGAEVATDDGSAGHHGRVTELLNSELDNNDHVTVYACGPPAMLEAVRALCVERGVPAQLALESPMACGFGACFGCVVPLAAGGYARTCVEGPVMDAAALAEVAA